MAMSVRTVGVQWRAVSNAVASTSSSVRCVVETGSWNRGAGRLTVESSSSGHFQCHAAGSATVTRDLVEMRRGSFEAEESCEQSRMYYGRRGGGDAYLVTRESSFSPAAAEDVMQTGKNRSEMVAAFEAALVGADRNAEALCEMGMRAWRKLGDADRAEQLFFEALQVAPENSAVQASYAQFLWQCDA